MSNKFQPSKYGIAGMIYKTKDYDVFEKAKGNRKVGNIAKLKASIREEGQLYEILVNEEMEVIDGQHRLEALRQLGFWVHFKVVEAAGKQEMISLNSVSKNWKFDNYLDTYAEEGIKDYVEMNDIKKQHQIGIMAILELFKVSHSSFKTGRAALEGRPECYATLDFLEQLRDKTGFKRIGHKSILSAYREVLFAENLDKKRLLDILTKESYKGVFNPLDIGQRKTDNIEVILKLYNRGMSKTNPKYINYYFDDKKIIKIGKL